MNRSIRILLALALISTCGQTYTVQAQTDDIQSQSNTAWKSHTAFDGQISKIIEGNRYVYVFAHQAYYHNNTRWDTYNDLRSTVLYIDKQDLSKGVRGLLDKYTPSGASVRVMNYNPRTSNLWICYSNGGIDVLEDSGTMHSIKDFMSTSRSLMGQMGTVSFDLYGDAWIAMDRGYARIDGGTFEVKEWANLDTAVESICRVGDKVVAIMDNALYETPETGDRSRKDSFHKHSELNITSANRILPISSGSFATLIDGSKLSLASWRNGNIALETKITDSNFSNQLCTSISAITDGTKYCFRGVVANQYENNFVPVKNGYLAFSTTSAHFLPFNSGADRLDVKSYKLPITAPRYVGTLDFDDFWFYETRKGFYTRSTVDQGATWSNASDKIQWQGPVAMLLSNMAYSSTRGVFVMNRFSTPRNFISFGGFGTMLLSGYKGGKWTNYSPIYGSPRSIDGNSALTSMFNRENSTPYPIIYPTGIISNSLHPDYVLVSSLGGGIIAVNTADIEGQIFRFSDANDPVKSYPGFMENFPNRNSWCKVLGEDADNNLWVCQMGVEDASVKNYGVLLMYWTPDDRNQAMAQNDIAKANKWGRIFFPTKDLPSELVLRSGAGVALKHPKNKHKIVVVCNSWGKQGLVVCDHNGTLEDTSDDKAELIYQIKTQDGLFHHKEYIMAVSEDPVTGNVWLSFDGKLISVDLTKPIKDGVAIGEEFRAMNIDGTQEWAVMSDYVYSIAYDEYNRMWVGTATSGVYGISADRKKVIAHYDMSNSPLRSNQVDGLCWAPDSKELMIGTNMGLFSVKPDRLGVAAKGQDAPMAFPTNVLPEYKGTIKFVNLPMQTMLTVCDDNGRQIKQLPVVDNGQTIWDVCDSDGQPVPQGVYTVRDVARQVNEFRIIVTR